MNDTSMTCAEEKKKTLSDPMEESKTVDPFVNDLTLTKWDYFVAVVGTVFLLPIRGLAIVFILVLSWIFARIGLLGLHPDYVDRVPLTGWRQKLKGFYSYLGLLVFWSAGFRVRIKGRQATRAEAPILVGAPHSSFLEAMIIIMCQCSPVSRHENKDAFLVSACQEFYQSIFVDRRSPESRKAAANLICARATDPDPRWNQIFIFPEGTNANRKKLIQFKLGAFNPGVPVQPVLVRYPGYESVDSVTWTFKQGHSYLFSVWLLLTKPVNRVEIEFLPVYVPDEDERKDPAVYAKNVQVHMARKLNVFASDETYYEHYKQYCLMMEKKKKNGIM